MHNQCSMTGILLVTFLGFGRLTSACCSMANATKQQNHVFWRLSQPGSEAKRLLFCSEKCTSIFELVSSQNQCWNKRREEHKKKSQGHLPKQSKIIRQPCASRQTKIADANGWENCWWWGCHFLLDEGAENAEGAEETSAEEAKRSGSRKTKGCNRSKGNWGYRFLCFSPQCC